MAAPKPSSNKAASKKEETEKKVKKTVHDYVDLIETVARVEYSRLPNHLIDFSELVNIGAIAVHVLLTNNPDREYNITYLSTSMKWAIRNELRYRYKWYAMKSNKDASDDDDENSQYTEVKFDKGKAREAVYSTILSVDSLLEGENPQEIRDDGYTPEEKSEIKEMAKVVREAINKLPEREKLIVEARFYKNMKMREIGSAFGISPSRISRVVQSGLNKIKKELVRRGYTSPPELG